MNKGCATSWHTMLVHLGRLVGTMTETLDMTGSDPTSILKAIKEVDVGSGTDL